MKRPLLIISISYIIGILIGVYLKQSIPLLIIISTIITLSLMFKIKKDRKILIYIIIILICIIVASYKTICLNEKYNNIYNKLDEQTIKIVGTVCGQIAESDYYYSVNVNNIKQLKDGKIVDEQLYKGIKLILYIKKNNNKDLSKILEYGNQLLIYGTYSEPEGARNYKGFSYKEYLKTKGISGSITVEEEKNIKIIEKNKINPISTAINKISIKFKNNLNAILSEKQAGLCIGILLGDSSNIDENIKNNFKNSNLSHMLAVSGTHVSYLIVALSLILNKKMLGNRGTKYANIIILIMFMIITNMSPSVLRAGISAILCIIATLFHRQADTYSSIGFSILFIHFLNPFSIFNIGMQLSYAGTIGIIMFNTPINEKIKNIIKEKQEKLIKDETTFFIKIYKKLKKYLIDSLSVTLSANILLIPLTIYNFNSIPLNFILSNVIAGPVLGLVIILGIITLFCSCISLEFTKIIVFPLKLSLNLIIKIILFISKLFLKNIIVITPPVISIMIFYIIIFLIFTKKEKTKRIFFAVVKKYGAKLIAFITMIIIISISTMNFLLKDNSLKIYFIDVGQGDSSLIETSSGKTILIDGGGNENPEKYDIGEKVLVPYLLDRSISKIDYVMISHFDSDHVGGLLTVMENLHVKEAIISKQKEDSQNYQKFLKIAKEKEIKVRVVCKGDRIKIDNETYLEILWPQEKQIEDNPLNNNSIVAKLVYKDFSILFTGDIEEIAEKEILKIYNNSSKLKSNIIKVAHHGSKSSSIEEFLNAVSPEIALIGVGEDNKFGHPNEQVIERLKKLNCKIYRTDINGEIDINIKEKKKTVKVLYNNK